MKIVICGSMSASKEMMQAKNNLEFLGHDVTVPEFTAEYAKMASIKKMTTESARNKVEYDLIRGYFNTIRNNEALLVVNVEKHGTAGYIGANTFLEMGFAHVLDKPIYLFNPAPVSWHADEITAMRPYILNGQLKDIQ